MRFIWTTAVKDWRRRRRNPLEVFLWIGIPLIIGLLMVVAFGGTGGPRPQAHVLVADEDHTLVSGFLLGALSRQTADGFVRAEEVDREEGRARMENGDATALIVIPKGFSDAVLREEPAALELVTNPSQRILPGIVEEGLSILVDGTFYVHRLIGEDLRAFAEGLPSNANTFPDETIAAFSVKINRLMDRLSGYLSPVVISLDTSVDEDEDPAGADVSIGFLMFPSILFMALLFMAQGLSDDIWEERARRTLHRMAVSPQHIVTFLLGKALSGAALVFLVCLIAMGIGYAYLALDPLTLPAALVWGTSAGTLFMTGMTTIQVHARSQRAGSILTMAIMFPLMMIGGSFFPFEAMPPWMATIGSLTPNGWALQLLKDIMLHRTDAGSIFLSLLMVMTACVALFLVNAHRIRRGFSKV